MASVREKEEDDDEYSKVEALRMEVIAKRRSWEWTQNMHRTVMTILIVCAVILIIILLTLAVQNKRDNIKQMQNHVSYV